MKKVGYMIGSCSGVRKHYEFPGVKKYIEFAIRVVSENVIDVFMA